MLAHLLREIPPLLDRFYHSATEHGYYSLAVIALLDGVGLPFTAEVVLIAFAVLVNQHQVAFWPALLLAAGANALGSLGLAALGRWGGSRLVFRWMKEGSPAYARVHSALTRYAVPAIVLTRVTTLFRLPTVAMAGYLRLPAGRLAASLWAASCLWLYLGYHTVHLLGVHGSLLVAQVKGRWVEVLVVAALLAAGALAFWLRHRRPAK